MAKKELKLRAVLRRLRIAFQRSDSFKPYVHFLRHVIFSDGYCESIILSNMVPGQGNAMALP